MPTAAAVCCPALAAANRKFQSVMRASPKAPSRAADLLSALHELWMRVCQVPNARELSGFVDRCRMPDKAVAKAMALLRIGEASKAGELLAGVRALLRRDPGAFAALSAWQALTISSGGHSQETDAPLADALKATSDPNSLLHGLHGLTLWAVALADYRKGEVAHALQALGQLASCSSNWGAKYPAFDAETRFLQAKCLREQSSYKSALQALHHCHVYRRKCGDAIVEAKESLEIARIQRFMGDTAGAEAELEQHAREHLEGTGFAVWLARLEDQSGDIARHKGDLTSAQAHYALAKQWANRVTTPGLQAHLANSEVRLLEDRADRLAATGGAANQMEATRLYTQALALLDGYDHIWMGSRSHGKHLLLKATLSRKLGRIQDALRALGEAIPKLEAAQQWSYLALAYDCRARIEQFLGKLTEACSDWARALDAATKVQSSRFYERIAQYAGQLPQAKLVQLIKELWEALNRSARSGRELRFAGGRIFCELNVIGHQFARMVSESGGSNKSSRLLQGYLRNWSTFLGVHDFPVRNPPWEPLPAQPVRLPELVKAALRSEFLGKAGSKLKVSVSHGGPAIQACRATCEHVLALVFAAIAKVTAARRLNVAVTKSRSPGCSAEVIVRAMDAESQSFVTLDLALDFQGCWFGQTIQPLIEQGYEGELTLACYLTEYGLGGKLGVQPADKLVRITLP